MYFILVFRQQEKYVFGQLRCLRHGPLNPSQTSADCLMTFPLASRLCARGNDVVAPNSRASPDNRIDSVDVRRLNNMQASRLPHISEVLEVNNNQRYIKPAAECFKG